MRNIVNNVIGSNDIVGGIVRALVVVAKREVAMLQDSLRHLHLAMRRGSNAPAGSWLFSQPKLQPAYAAARSAAPTATAATCRGECRYYTASRPSIRIG
ncbi:MAG: hypothetical protein K8U03_16020 [Planctomycetia bacterium]|nr:hypothetical protein [Planctomycetia bacterium]